MEIGNELWPLDELTARVAAALAEGYEGAPSGRVRDVPDRRTIRYYTTLGLIDRPAEMRGRTALYGRRHVLQLVAIKKLQAAGKSLSEVQRTLAGRTDAELSRIASAEPGEPSPPAARAARSERAFWKQKPEGHAAPSPLDVEMPANNPGWLQGVPLAAGVTLLLSPARPIDREDIEAIGTAAAPLIHLLTKSRLIDPATGGEPR